METACERRAPSSRNLNSKRRMVCLAALVCLAGMTAGCASNGATIGTSSDGNATVSLLGTSTANDQLSSYDLVVNTLTLAKQDGTTVSVLSAPLHVEFIHLNGSMEPLATVSLPQGTYTSATATVSIPRFDCVGLNSSGAIVSSAFAYDSTLSPQVTVNVSTAITIGPGHSNLALNLLVSKSAAWTTCVPNGIEPFSITPTFNLTNLTQSVPSMTGLEGRVASVNAAANTFSVTANDGVSCATSNPSECKPAPVDGPVWQVEGAANTVLQGISNLSLLQPGMPVDMDGSVQADGSVLASRISVLDTSTTNVTGFLGPVLFRSQAWPVLNVFDLEAWGPLAVGGSAPINFSDATFQASGQFTDLQNLPFTAGFTSGDMVAGQRVLITSHATSIAAGPTYVPATTVTLLPQTINGIVTSISSVSGLSVYNVALPSYDLFPQLATQAGQLTLLGNPNTVMVYLSNSRSNTTPVAVGSVLRFTGLIFNDGGTLKMDCASVNQGVTD